MSPLRVRQIQDTRTYFCKYTYVCWTFRQTMHYGLYQLSTVSSLIVKSCYLENHPFSCLNQLRSPPPSSPLYALVLRMSLPSGRPSQPHLSPLSPQWGSGSLPCCSSETPSHPNGSSGLGSACASRWGSQGRRHPVWPPCTGLQQR